MYDPPRRPATRPVLGAVGIVAGVLLGGCSAPRDADSQVFAGLVASHTQSSGSVVFTGDVTGTWRASSETGSICGPTQITITVRGPLSHDVGNLVAWSDGSVLLDAEAYGDFHGSDATFSPGSGFAVDSDITTLRGKHAHVKGALTC
jgi:hypothetical protein